MALQSVVARFRKAMPFEGSGCRGKTLFCFCGKES